MRKFITCIVIFFTFTLVVDNQVSAKEVINEEVLFKYSDSCTKARIINDDYLAIEKKNKSYLYNKTKNILLGEGSLVDSFIYNEVIYTIVIKDDTSLLYSYNTSTHDIDYISMDKTIINSYQVFNSDIFLLGTKSEDSYIAVINDDFEIDEEFNYGGKGYEEITNSFILDDHLCLCIYKSGISLDSEFINTKTKDDYVSIICELDSDFDVINTFYFNEEANIEKIEQINCSNSIIDIILKADSNKYYYSLDNSFKIITKELIENDTFYLLPNYKTNRLLLTIKEKDKTISLNESDTVIKTLSERGTIFDLKVIKGELYLYIVNSSSGKLFKINEYEVIQNDNTIITYSSYNTPKDDHFKAESFFETLDFKLNESSPTTPYLEANIHGTYTLNFESDTLSGRTIKEESTLIIKEFTNFIDNGIYKKGKVLQFFGRAYLNGELINYGHILDKSGEYNLIIKDVNNNEKSYHLIVVDNYYNNEEIINVDADLTVLPLEKCYYTLNLDYDIVVNSVIINGNSYNRFTQDGRKLCIEFLGKETYSVNNYYLELVNFTKDNVSSSFDVYQNIIVTTSKIDAVLVADRELNLDNVNVDVNVTDLYQTFMYLEVIKEQNGSEMEVMVFTSNDKIELDYSKGGTLTINAVFYNGNKIEKKELVHYSVENTKVKVEVSLVTSSGKLTNISLNVSIPKKYDNIKSLSLCSIDAKTYYDNYEQYDILGAVIVISVVMVVLIIVSIIIVKLIKRRNLK